MDPFSALVGTLQIVGQCAQVTVSLAKYINQVVTVDQRIRSFYEDVTKLQTTYETLEQCRSSPQMVAAAKAADQFTEHLWSHLATTLKDCENTLVAINHVLKKINKPLGLSAHLRQFLESPMKQLLEQLHVGELGRHHEKIRMFNTSLALPMQMINITLQLNQRDLSEEHQRRLEDRLTAMQRTIDLLHNDIAELRRPQPAKRSYTMGSGTLIEGQDVEKAVCEHMETFADRAKQFLSNASSAAASTRSGASTVQLDIVLPFRGTSEAGMPLSQKERKRISAWVPTLQEESTTSPNESEATPSPVTEYANVDTDEEDFELDLVRTYFENGQKDLEQDEFAAAEENFIEAMKGLQNSDFGERLAFQSADVVLMLTHCYVEQNKFDQAIELLLPLTDDIGEETMEKAPSSSRSPPLNKHKKRPDHGRVLAAHHTLGNVYLKKQDHESAEKHSLCAFKGRRKLFGKDHEKTIESVQLLVEVYSARGERAKARAYSKHLVADADQGRRMLEQNRRPSTNINPGPGPRPTILKELSPIERAQTAPILTVPSPPLLPTAVMRKISIDSHPTESHITNNIQSHFSSSVFDDASTISSVTKSSTRRGQSITPRHYLKPRFDAVKTAAATSRDKACEAAQHILRGYDPDPSKILIHRWDDIKKNIKKQGADRGLAATGSGYAPIHFFCELKDEAITEVELLIEDGADLMALRYRAGYGKQEPMTPLQLAIEKDHQTLATMIIDALQASGISPNQLMALKDRDDLSPLLVACRRGQIDTVTHLLEFGSGIVSAFPRFWCGNSLLHDASSRCDIDMVNLLLSIRGHESQRRDIGTINQQDQFGRTPLMYAVILKNIPDQSKRNSKLRGRLQCVERLVRHAADIGVLDRTLLMRDAQMMNASAYAKDEGDTRLMELLESYGAGE